MPVFHFQTPAMCRMWQGEVHAQNGRLCGAPSWSVHHRMGHGGRRLRLLRSMGLPWAQVLVHARVRLRDAGLYNTPL